MKRTILALTVLLMLVTQSKAATLKIVQPEGSVTMTRPSGSEINLKDSTNKIRWWKVKSGGVEIIDNKFIMPENDAKIVAKGGKTTNKLTISENGMNKVTENKTVGEQITLTADTYGDYFLYWRINGVDVGNRANSTISFTMPANDVTAIPVYKAGRINEEE